MKRNLLLSTLLIALFSVNSIAQSNKTPLNVRQVPQAATIHSITGLEQYEAQAEVPASSSGFANFRQDLFAPIGTTSYELQSNSSVRRALYNHGEGIVSAVWTMSKTVDGAYADRGTGYNQRTADGEWADFPDERLESNNRTGWPNVVGLPDGSDLIVSHGTAPAPAAPYFIMVLKNDSGEWVETQVDSDLQAGILWPRSAVGGTDGNTIHVVAVTTPLAFGGSIHEGVETHMLYYRSTDGGATWDIKDMIIPGIDSSEFHRMSADAYYIDAYENTVAVGIFTTWGGDILVSKSTDNGSTWETTRVYDFPLENYDLVNTDTTYTEDDIPPVADTTFNSLSIYTTDAAGHVMVDNNGKVHAWWGQTLVYDDTAGDDGAYNFFPAAYDQLGYWNEDMGADSIRQVGGLIDNDGDGEINFSGDVPNIGEGIVSHPSASLGVDGTIYLAYDAATEFAFDNANDNGNQTTQQYRHVYIIESTDGGETWSEPFDIINENTFSNIAFAQAYDCVYPTFAKKGDEDVLHLAYKGDLEPGGMDSNLSADSDPIEENEIHYIRVNLPLGTVAPSDINDLEASLNFEVNPNPAKAIGFLNYDLQEASPVKFTITDINGRVLDFFSFGNVPAGTYSKQLDLTDYASGIYLVRMQSNGASLTKKLIVQ